MITLHPELMWQLTAEHRRDLDRSAALPSKHPVVKRSTEWWELRRYGRMPDTARPSPSLFYERATQRLSKAAPNAWSGGRAKPTTRAGGPERPGKV